ncbi:hypothetical protein [Acinetobacter towneri]|uniref:hypothetical protein n=1 Tax=Acinetobacter towneri TaxID=202956 RepID=UPI0032120605
MKILNGQEAFAELSAGRIIEARRKDAIEFDSLDNFPATIMVNPEYEFRIALTFITIGEMQVPEPLKEAPAKGTQCFAPSLLTEELSKSFKWKNSDLDLALLQRGQVHLEQEHAVIHAQALIVIGGGTTQPAVEAQVQDEIESITQAESDLVDEVLDEADPVIQKFIDAIDKCSSDYDLQGVERNLDGNQNKLHNVEYEQLKQRIAEKRESFFENKQPVITAQHEPVENEVTETEQPSLSDLIDDQAKSAVQDKIAKDAMSGNGQASYPIDMLYTKKKQMLISKIQEMDSIEALERLAPAIPAAKLNPEDHQELLRIYAERKTAMQHADA